MKRLVVVLLWLLLLIGLLGVQGLGSNATTPPPEITPAVVNSTYACYLTCILPNYIIAEDLDSDGWLDLSVSCFGSSQVWIYRNLAVPPVPKTGPKLPSVPGAFLVNHSSLGGPINVPLGPVALVSGRFGLIADKTKGAINKGDQIVGVDGYPDLGVLSSVSQQVTGANFGATPPPQPIPSLWNAPNPLPAPPVHMAVGDFDRADGLSDVVVLDAGIPSLGTPPALYFYTSAGFVSAVVPWAILLPPFQPTFVVVADFNQDGWDDVAVSDTANTVTIYYVVGGAPIGISPIALGAISPTGMDVADFNNDGFPDIVVVGNNNVGNGFAQVLLNTVLPRGFRLLPPQPTWGLNARFVEAFDADGNGWPDFAVANFGSHTITIFLTQPGNASGQPDYARNTRDIVCLEPKVVDITTVPKFKYELQCGYYPTGIASGDFDRNGKMDMAITLYSATEEICPQNTSCIEVIFDVACGKQPDQQLHQINPQYEPQECKSCKVEPCKENVPPEAEIQTEGETKNP